MSKAIMDKILKKLRVGIYSPYLHIFGGGERYLLQIAESLSKDHEVYLYTDSSIREKAKYTFNISLDRVKFLPIEKINQKNVFKKYEMLRSYDIFFFTTDGSLFLPAPCQNFLVIQSPAHIPELSLLNKIKLLRWKVICYSKFVERIIYSRIKKESIVLPPAIDTKLYSYDFSQKRNIILSVGRFYSHLHDKKHRFLVDVFKKTYKKNFPNWELIIAGGLTEKVGKEIVKELKKKSRGYRIKILINLPFDKLIKVYQQAKIYWHAAGFGEDLEKFPERAEHFGITTVEAMAAGAVPVVFKAGGQKEIITEGKNGYLYQTEEELVKKTYKLIKDKKLLERLSNRVVSAASYFSSQRFYAKLTNLLQK